MKAIARTFVVLSLGAAACGGRTEQLELTFPDEASMAATSVLAVTAFEPLLFSAESDVPELVRCDDVGVFPPTRVVDPDSLTSFPNLGRLLSEHRKTQTYPLSEEWSVEIADVKPDSATNPWGAVLVYVEARGEVRVSQEQGGGQVSATLLAGCYCIRTQEGSHPNRQLDQAVKTACSPIEDAKGPRAIELEPVLPDVFRLEACGVQQLTSPRNQVVSPGPAVCATTRRCDDVGGTSQSCFRCTQPCKELDDLGNVPVMFTVDQPGGGTTPATQIVLSNGEGRSSGTISVDNCASDISVRAQVVGRSDTSVDFTVQCVDPVTSFTCDEEILPAGKEPRGITRIPGAPGEVDFVAVLYDTGTDTSVEVSNPLVPGATRVIELPNETARAIHGFSYELGTRGGVRGRPALAVVTSVTEAARERVKLYVYEWVNGELVPHDGSALPGAPITGDCPEWVCGTAMPACTGSPQPCSCRLTVEFQTEVTITAADVDGDGRSDLAIGTSSDLPITTYYSTKTSSTAMFDAEGCACGRYAQAPTTFELLDYGGPGERPESSSPDLVIGAPGGAFVRYGARTSRGEPVISCGQPSRFGGLVPIRDLARGRFLCDARAGSAACEGWEDIVVV
ncbi:hypothetical protein L6R52_37425, partial [Myxococcota bacterium]|nr:hypothetical protein [Myxococcota bacterium]